MTAPTAHLDAAQLLSVPAEAIASVETLDDGVRIVAMATGTNVVYRIEGDGTVMYQHKPDPARHYDFPVYEPPVEVAGDDEPDSEREPDNGPPSGKVADVVDWVRGGPEGTEPTDGWEARADTALAAELAKDKPRASLIDILEALVPAEGDAAGTEGDDGAA